MKLLDMIKTLVGKDKVRVKPVRDKGGKAVEFLEGISMCPETGKIFLDNDNNDSSEEKK